ncbi:ferrous iron transport protein A [Flavobacterium psychrophilum]|uniref:Ferrous iron transport protein A n=2 Tax=Flavobacterium psychrophilum TaxID=96345 RepID=A6GVT5_FLAPJ|nr:FeoA family protein [Flavobacterium psychrophilum]AIG29039.1 iron transporter [Flavobacterium psychrophilum]AIG31315.1 iron transporter [Flavobacterium psychrophilum]AIG35735.1 iron transporter [Flavobacterium psychrophilum]AIG35841.1 iron transporter [Flavobacterium psychrophilum]AIG38096.1 iron transporter [Flavobacterium psychrophilum]
MNLTISNLAIGQKAIIKDFDINMIPLKLLEMGCLSGNMVEIIQIAPFGDPLYLNINDSHVAIRLEMASIIEVEIPTENQV